MVRKLTQCIVADAVGSRSHQIVIVMVKVGCME